MDSKQLTSSISETATQRRPFYGIATAALCGADRPLAKKLGRELYALLTRDPSKPLTAGSGIPVAVDFIQSWEDALQPIADLADHLLVVLVAGSHALLVDSESSFERIGTICQLAKSDATGRLRLVLVPSDSRWLAEAQRFEPDLVVGQSVAAFGDFQQSTDEILIATLEHLQHLESHDAKADVSSLKKPSLLMSPLLWEKLQNPSKRWELNKVTNHSIFGYFQTIQPNRERLWRTIPNSGQRFPAVLATSHAFSYSQPSLLSKEIIVALQRDWPIVKIPDDLLVSGPSDTRNSVGLVGIARMAATDHLKQLYFLVMARQLIQRAQLPHGTAILCRPPELLDFTSGLLRNDPSRILIHPDPILTPEHREIIRATKPRVSLVTPSSLLIRYDSTSGRQVTPLQGLRIGISASSMEEHEFSPGYIELHLEDAIIQIARNLLGGGAKLSYGGDFSFRSHTSLTPILAQLAQIYPQTADSPRELLEAFQPADGKLEDIPSEIHCRSRHLGLSRDLQSQAIFTAEEIPDLPSGMKYSDLRRVMNQYCDARIAIGGQCQPRQSDDNGRGYGGRFPGIAEEVYRALVADQPVYLCGGFGGITQRLADLMDRPDRIDSFWDDTAARGNLRFTQLRHQFDTHPRLAALELPRNLMQLAEAVARVAEYHGTSDEQWLDFNGLTYQQNRELWRATDPTLISALITQGLMQWRSRIRSGLSKLKVEAIHGDITTVTGADMLALSVFDDIEPQGAGAAIDRITGGLISRTQSTPGRLIGVRSEGLDVDYLTVMSLGKLEDSSSDLEKRIRDSARAVARLCSQEGFQSVAVVTFGGSLQQNYRNAVRLMLEGFQAQSDELLIKWVEYQPERYNELVECLRDSQQVELSTVIAPSGSATTTPHSYPWFSLTVNLHGDRLEVSGLPRESGGVAWTEHRTLSVSELNDLAAGIGSRYAETPQQLVLEERGLRLAELLFGEQIQKFGQWLRESPLAITHNAAASKLPFELLRFGNEEPSDVPALANGIHRWLKVSGSPTAFLNTRPKQSRGLRVGLVIDPTEDLVKAKSEGEGVTKALSSLGAAVRVLAIGHGQQRATKERVLELFPQVDILHYCGHANFNEAQRDQAALFLADGKLSAAELRQMAVVPRVIIINACQAGRVRAAGSSDQNDFDTEAHSHRNLQGQMEPENKSTNIDQHQSFSLAEVILRAGVEAFISTYWEVNDASAESFAMALYRSLLEGKTLRDSLILARRQLAQHHQKDWANYILYGDGRFRLG